MTGLQPWFERKFANDFPVELVPNLLVRLRGTPARLEEALRSTPETLRVKRADDGWSIQENAGHLLDLETLWSTRVEDYFSDREDLTPADLKNTKTHEAGHNDRPGSEILEAFRTVRLGWLSRLEGLERSAFELTRKHPRLGTPMRLVDLLFFTAEHDDHHLARIEEIRREIG